jgi:hypothetical protein
VKPRGPHLTDQSFCGNGILQRRQEERKKAGGEEEEDEDWPSGGCLLSSCSFSRVFVDNLNSWNSLFLAVVDTYSPSLWE